MHCIADTNISLLECTWKRTIPSVNVLVMYLLVIPMFAMFGCVANALNAIVFMRPKMTPSVFTYLSILSWVDSLCCMIILCTCISRTICLNSLSWIYYDLQFQCALFGTLSGAANWILVAVTLDRIIYLCHRLPQTKPKFCTRPVARRNVCGIILMSAVLNGPYYFMFKIENDGSFYATNFYKSNFYRIHNWFSFTLLGIIPGIFLLIGNIAVIIIFRRWVNKFKSLPSSDSKDNLVRRNRQEHQFKLTISIIIVVFLYIFGELPGHLTSRRNAVNLVFGGDVSKIDFEKVEKYESFFLTLNVIQLSFNIVVYAVINPAFMIEFFVFLREISNIFCLMLGFNAVRKCWKQIGDRRRRRRGRQQNNVNFENPDSISYYNEIFTIEEEYHNSIRLDMKIKENNKFHVRRKTASCLDMRLVGPGTESEEGIGCKSILQRHSQSF